MVDEKYVKLDEEVPKKSRWINNEIRIFDKDAIEKPCHKCGFCPYGALVEEFPLHPEFKDVSDEDLNNLGDKINTGYNCTVFGHDCPVFYQAEPIVED